MGKISYGIPSVVILLWTQEIEDHRFNSLMEGLRLQKYEMMQVSGGLRRVTLELLNGHMYEWVAESEGTGRNGT